MAVNFDGVNMKKVLYISNIEVPYRVRFFNELAQNCELTVLYERRKSSNRNNDWAQGEEKRYRIKYLRGIRFAHENAFSLGILKEIFGGYDKIIVGCFNSPVQVMAILVMRLCRVPYILNLDGEMFIGNRGLKSKLKRWILQGANKYLVAGEKAAGSLSIVAPKEKIVTYHFSSLSQSELEEHSKTVMSGGRNDTVLVVGQYLDYKGMDVALKAAAMDMSIKYKFVGMGSRTQKFMSEHVIPANVQIVPFLQKQNLEKEYQSCAMLVLPSRQECWGLVINEAASYGMPIVSTWGSGAAVEFLADAYPQYLAEPGDAESLICCIRSFFDSENKVEYGRYLLEKANEYSIEKSVGECLVTLS